MPSTIIRSVSGGAFLVSGNVFSGSILDVGTDYPTAGGRVGGIQLRLAKLAPGTVYIGLPNLSGTVNTSTSGGDLSSGGLTDGMELNPSESFFVPRSRLVSGLQSIKIIAAAASSGGRLFWEML